MKHLSLAARYRPQTFAAVAGQPLAAAALSRAAATGKIAPAYLLSGTRGVGKTTIARIFAKALNCEHAPTPEPCNECSQCRHILAGNHVDVNEIDGASNTGVDDVRALRETIGFLPMEGRYKIFIVDEAHMLSKNAFNALLKTLEEPPRHTVFIFATTEAHRFPATIISRCQHFVFRHLSEEAIYTHLARILGEEKIEYEDPAIRLIARRASGSVRDSLSLLDQTLAITDGKLTQDTVRTALGVAGQELFGRLFQAIAKNDLGLIMELATGLLNSGIDMGFFTRELSTAWRNLFLLRQAGDTILPTLAINTEDEAQFLRDHAALFDPAHLHAAWQMTLDSQRGITQSPEPGAALELLLLNLALLPRLLPIATVPDGVLATSSPETSPAVRGSPEAPSWAGFCSYCQEKSAKGQPAPPIGILKGLKCTWTSSELKLFASSEHLAKEVASQKPLIEKLLAEYSGGNLPKITYTRARAARSEQELIAISEEDPGVRLACEVLDAHIHGCEEKPGEEEEN